MLASRPSEMAALPQCFTNKLTFALNSLKKKTIMNSNKGVRFLKLSLQNKIIIKVKFQALCFSAVPFLGLVRVLIHPAKESLDSIRVASHLYTQVWGKWAFWVNRGADAVSSVCTFWKGVRINRRAQLLF